jgi:hypothetical protein
MIIYCYIIVKTNEYYCFTVEKYKANEEES